MIQNSKFKIPIIVSIIIPVYNEEKNIPLIYAELKKVLDKMSYDYEIIFIDDGSADNSTGIIKNLAAKNNNIKLIQFSRNFGKEIAISAGIKNATGSAIIIIDADLQHPAEKIPEFLEKWERGAEVVIGVRNKNKSETIFKKIGSFLFYKIINSISDVPVVPQATDFRLIDRIVAEEFNKFTERNRLARGLIDWLGFKRDFVYFDAKERINGKAKYGATQLVQLALSSFISLSMLPLKFAGYLGIFIIMISGPMGLFIFIEKYILKDPWGLSISGSAILAVIILFLVGIILISLGLIALYIANIQAEALNRPMYVIRREKMWISIKY
jgi:polyisoprenyl-phosphate glycosyltransferase